MTDPSRDIIDTDVVIVGAGPAGLAAAIRIKQLAPHLSVTVVEKSAEIGGHILSGAVMNPVGLDELLPGWRHEGAPVGPAVTEDRFHFLTAARDIVIPDALVPPQMRTSGAVIVSLGRLVAWLGSKAQALGVDIYPMTAATELLLGEGGEVQGIVTGDLGRARDGSEKPGFAAGIGLRARYTLIGEGARGSLAKQLSARFGLDRDADPQHYGLGIKEIWQVAPERHQPGRVDHYLGYPFDNQTSGGGFVYHADGGQVYLGLVTHLDYSDPTLSPFDEFQRFKTHPAVASLLAGATRVSYGARAVTSGGLQSIPTLAFPGGALIGCAAGFMNFPALKAIHSAFRSGRAAGEQVVEAIAAGRAHDAMTGLDRAVRATGIEAELVAVQNVKPLLARFGTLGGMVLGGADLWSRALFRASPFGALRNRQADSAALRKVNKTRIYDKPDGRLTFDRASSVFLANLSHDEDQPSHLRLADAQKTATETIPRYGAEPAPNYCPAGVYQLVEGAEGPELRINAANCVHCKTCDIKDPAGNITWVPPEGGSGPNYSGM